jgi:hypothetical protein
MRSLLIAAAALALPGAAQARPHSDAPIADSFPPPQVIDRGAVALDRMIDGLLQVDVGPVADAIDPARPHGPKTLGDLGRRNDPYFDERLHHSVGALADSMIELQYRMHRLEPVLRRSLEDAARNVENALHDVPDRRDYRDYRDDRGY